MQTADNLRKNAEEKIRSKINTGKDDTNINAHNSDFGPLAFHRMPMIGPVNFFNPTKHQTRGIASGTWASNYYLYGEGIKTGGDANGYKELHQQMKNDYRVAVERCHLWANAAGGPGESKNWVPMTRDANMTQRTEYEDDYVKALKEGAKATKTVKDLKTINTGTDVGNYQIAKYTHNPKPEKGEFDGEVEWETGKFRWKTNEFGQGALYLNDTHTKSGTVNSEITLREIKDNTINSVTTEKQVLENKLNKADAYGKELEDVIKGLYNLTLDPDESIQEENITGQEMVEAIVKKLQNG